MKRRKVILLARMVKSKTSKTDTAIKSESLDFEDVHSSDKEIKEAEKTGVPFEEALAKLEIIVKEMEAGELTLENSLAKFAEGVSLSKICLNKLNFAQAKIDEILREENGELILKPFQPQEEETE